MGSHSLQSLLAWMKDNSRLWGWDAIVALAAPQVNEGLGNVYINRLIASGEQRMPAGSFAIPDTDLSVHLQDVILGAPVFGFEQASLDFTDMQVTLPLLNGRETMLKAGPVGSTIERIAVYDPTNAPPLKIELKLLTSTRSVELDLARNHDVKFMFGSSLVQQMEGGKFFQKWLEAPENNQRVFALVTFPAQGNPLMATRQIEVRTQSDKASGGAARQALMLFITMEHGSTGAIPADEGPDFLFLIPNDTDQAFSATAVFSLHLQHRAAFGHAVMQMLGNPPFDYIGDVSGMLKHMVAKGGSITVPGVDWQTEGFAFESDDFDISVTAGAQPLTLEFAVEQALQHWQFPCTVAFRYRRLPSNEWIEVTGGFEVRLEHEFHLAPDETGASAMEGHLFAPYALSGEVRAVSGVPGDLPTEELAAITGFIGQIIKRALLGKFASTLTTAETDTFLGECAFADNFRLRSQVAALPYDLALFGKVGESLAPLTIVEQQPFLPAGGQQQFTTAPVVAGLRWTVESLPGNVGSPGSIDAQTGLYQAPPAHAMGGLFERAIVFASNPATGDKSMTAVTIVAHSIMVKPLLYVCNYGERVELAAASLGGGTLTWTIKNPVPGESGQVVPSTEPGGDRTYIAHDKVPDKTFVFDEIEVSNGQAGQNTSACIVVLHAPQTLSVKPAPDAGLPAGQVQLEARINQTKVAAQWSLPFAGPGSISPQGVYNEQASAKDLFVVIAARFDDDEFGSFAGCLVLPLPLEGSSGLIEILAD